MRSQASWLFDGVTWVVTEEDGSLQVRLGLKKSLTVLAVFESGAIVMSSEITSRDRVLFEVGRSADELVVIECPFQLAGILRRRIARYVGSAERRTVG